MKYFKHLLFLSSLCSLVLFIPLTCFGQSNSSVIPNELGDTFIISNHPKSLTNFSFRIPVGFVPFREGRDNSLIQIFTKTDYSERLDISGEKVNSSVIQFAVTVMKWADFPKYKMILSMSDSEVKDLMIKNMKSRDKSIDPNEFSHIYEKNNLSWIISGSWNKEKNLYLIAAVLSTNKQSINFQFITTYKENIDLDVNNLKKLIDSFKYI
jgi:hypothetical protein